MSVRGERAPDGRVRLRVGFVTTRGGDLRAALTPYLRHEARAWRFGHAALAVTIQVLTPPAGPRPDLDNIAKGVLDALKGRLFADDRQVERLVVERVAVFDEKPALLIEIERREIPALVI